MRVIMLDDKVIVTNLTYKFPNNSHCLPSSHYSLSSDLALWRCQYAEVCLLTQPSVLTGNNIKTVRKTNTTYTWLLLLSLQYWLTKYSLFSHWQNFLNWTTLRVVDLRGQKTRSVYSNAFVNYSLSELHLVRR